MCEGKGAKNSAEAGLDKESVNEDRGEEELIEVRVKKGEVSVACRRTQGDQSSVTEGGTDGTDLG